MKVNNTIVISVGQAGNQIASEFWKAICQEHQIDSGTGLVASGKVPQGNWSAFFSTLGESSQKSYVPRAILVDLEPSVLEQVRTDCPSLFHPGSFIQRTEGAGGNFAVGYLGQGREVMPEVMERVALEIDKCDQVGGIIVIHATGGGTGSGLGCAIIESIKEQYPEHPVLSCAVLPSPQVSSVVTEPYNTVFCLHTLRRAADACLIFDNEALYDLASQKWGIESPSVDELNLLITEALTGLTAPMRFSGFLTVEISLRELLTNLVPQPSLHFLMCSVAPLTPPDQSKFEDVSIEQMIASLFDNHSFFAKCSPMDGRFLSTAVLHRGVMDDKSQADAALAAQRTRLPLTSWIPTAFKIGYVEQAGAAHRRSMVLVANNTEIARVLDQITEKFDKLWHRKAFANWYLSEGMTDDQINELRASAQELVQSYQLAEESGTKAKAQDTLLSGGEVLSAAESVEAVAAPAETGYVPQSGGSFSLKDLVDR